MARALLAGLVAAAAVLGVNDLYAQDSLQNLANRLVALRGEVDELQSELDLAREEHKNKMSYLSAQKAELEANRDRQRLRIQQLEQELEDFRQEQAAAGDDADTLRPVVADIILRVREQVATGFPFKVQERLAELDDIDTQLANRVVTPQRAVNRLWAFLDDEIRISRENAIYSQTINLEGENVLADVAKLGTVMMYFKTGDNRYGRVVRRDDGWRYETLDDAGDQEQVENLFDSLRKQIRQGYFQLPYAIAASDYTAVDSYIPASPLSQPVPQAGDEAGSGEAASGNDTGTGTAVADEATAREAGE